MNHLQVIRVIINYGEVLLWFELKLILFLQLTALC
jgi:hypothetical protein